MKNIKKISLFVFLILALNAPMRSAIVDDSSGVPLTLEPVMNAQEVAGIPDLDEQAVTKLQEDLTRDRTQLEEMRRIIDEKKQKAKEEQQKQGIIEKNPQVGSSTQRAPTKYEAIEGADGNISLDEYRKLILNKLCDPASLEVLTELAEKEVASRKNLFQIVDLYKRPVKGLGQWLEEYKKLKLEPNDASLLISILTKVSKSKDLQSILNIINENQGLLNHLTLQNEDDLKGVFLLNTDDKKRYYEPDFLSKIDAKIKLILSNVRDFNDGEIKKLEERITVEKKGNDEKKALLEKAQTNLSDFLGNVISGNEIIPEIEEREPEPGAAQTQPGTKIVSDQEKTLDGLAQIGQAVAAINEVAIVAQNPEAYTKEQQEDQEKMGKVVTDAKGALTKITAEEIEAGQTSTTNEVLQKIKKRILTDEAIKKLRGYAEKIRENLKVQKELGIDGDKAREVITLKKQLQNLTRSEASSRPPSAPGSAAGSRPVSQQSSRPVPAAASLAPIPKASPALSGAGSEVPAISLEKVVEGFENLLEPIYPITSAPNENGILKALVNLATQEGSDQEKAQKLLDLINGPDEKGPKAVVEERIQLMRGNFPTVADPAALALHRANLDLEDEDKQKQALEGVQTILKDKKDIVALAKYAAAATTNDERVERVERVDNVKSALGNPFLPTKKEKIFKTIKANVMTTQDEQQKKEALKRLRNIADNDLPEAKELLKNSGVYNQEYAYFPTIDKLSSPADLGDRVDAMDYIEKNSGKPILNWLGQNGDPFYSAFNKKVTGANFKQYPTSLLSNPINTQVGDGNQKALKTVARDALVSKIVSEGEARPTLKSLIDLNVDQVLELGIKTLVEGKWTDKDQDTLNKITTALFKMATTDKPDQETLDLLAQLLGVNGDYVKDFSGLPAKDAINFLSKSKNPDGTENDGTVIKTAIEQEAFKRTFPNLKQDLADTLQTKLQEYKFDITKTTRENREAAVAKILAELQEGGLKSSLTNAILAILNGGSPEAFNGAIISHIGDSQGEELFKPSLENNFKANFTYLINDPVGFEEEVGKIKYFLNQVRKDLFEEGASLDVGSQPDINVPITKLYPPLVKKVLEVYYQNSVRRLQKIELDGAQSSSATPASNTPRLEQGEGGATAQQYPPITEEGKAIYIEFEKSLREFNPNNNSQIGDARDLEARLFNFVVIECNGFPNENLGQMQELFNYWRRKNDLIAVKLERARLSAANESALEELNRLLGPKTASAATSVAGLTPKGTAVGSLPMSQAESVQTKSGVASSQGSEAVGTMSGTGIARPQSAPAGGRVSLPAGGAKSDVGAGKAAVTSAGPEDTGGNADPSKGGVTLQSQAAGSAKSATGGAVGASAAQPGQAAGAAVGSGPMSVAGGPKAQSAAAVNSQGSKMAQETSGSGGAVGSDARSASGQAGQPKSAPLPAGSAVRSDGTTNKEGAPRAASMVGSTDQSPQGVLLGGGGAEVAGPQRSVTVQPTGQAPGAASEVGTASAVPASATGLPALTPRKVVENAGSMVDGPTVDEVEELTLQVEQEAFNDNEAEEVVEEEADQEAVLSNNLSQAAAGRASTVTGSQVPPATPRQGSVASAQRSNSSPGTGLAGSRSGTGAGSTSTIDRRMPASVVAPTSPRPTSVAPLGTDSMATEWPLAELMPSVPGGSQTVIDGTMVSDSSGLVPDLFGGTSPQRTKSIATSIGAAGTVIADSDAGGTALMEQVGDLVSGLIDGTFGGNPASPRNAAASGTLNPPGQTPGSVAAQSSKGAAASTGRSQGGQSASLTAGSARSDVGTGKEAVISAGSDKSSIGVKAPSASASGQAAEPVRSNSGNIAGTSSLQVPGAAATSVTGSTRPPLQGSAAGSRPTSAAGSAGSQRSITMQPSGGALGDIPTSARAGSTSSTSAAPLVGSMSSAPATSGEVVGNSESIAPKIGEVLASSLQGMQNLGIPQREINEFIAAGENSAALDKASELLDQAIIGNPELEQNSEYIKTRDKLDRARLVDALEKIPGVETEVLRKRLIEAQAGLGEALALEDVIKILSAALKKPMDDQKLEAAKSKLIKLIRNLLSRKRKEREAKLAGSVEKIDTLINILDKEGALSGRELKAIEKELEGVIKEERQERLLPVASSVTSRSSTLVTPEGSAIPVTPRIGVADGEAEPPVAPEEIAETPASSGQRAGVEKAEDAKPEAEKTTSQDSKATPSRDSTAAIEVDPRTFTPDLPISTDEILKTFGLPPTLPSTSRYMPSSSGGIFRGPVDSKGIDQYYNIFGRDKRRNSIFGEEVSDVFKSTSKENKEPKSNINGAISGPENKKNRKKGKMAMQKVEKPKTPKESNPGKKGIDPKDALVKVKSKKKKSK